MEKSDPAYQRQLEAGRARRAKAEVAYRDDFTQAVRDYLNSIPRGKGARREVRRALAKESKRQYDVWSILTSGSREAQLGCLGLVRIPRFA